MGKKLEKIREICRECGGEGKLSSCCQAESYDGRCGICGRFCKIEICHDCYGEGFNTYKLGDEVEIFVCIWSEEYLKDQLYRPKKLGDSKNFDGKLIEILDNWNVIVKVGRKKIKVKIEDISIR